MTEKSKSLVIVESPTKSRTLQSFLGPEYRVLSSFGHVRDLPKSEFGINVAEDFEPKYIVPQKAKKNVKLLKEETAKSNSVILATDEDREGEAIAWHLKEVLKLEDYRRIAFHEITKGAVQEALKKPRKLDMNLVNAQQTRRVLDRMVGYKLSPFLWKKVARGLSAGRVQSVAVKLVVEREREIEKFKPEEFWTIEARLKKEKAFEAQLAKKDGKPLDKLEIKSRKEAEKILKDLEGAEYRVVSVQKKQTKRNPLPPFTTSTLQQEAWRRFKFPAKLTMRIAQQLYETGKITYHRTDSVNLSSLALGSAKKFIEQKYGREYHQFRKYKTKGKAQEAHEAIRPTFAQNMPEKSGLKDNQLKLYDLIWKRFIACQMKEALFDSTKVEISAKNCGFETAGQTLKFEGFLKVYPLKYEEKELPLLEEKDLLELLELKRSQHFTQPPARYSEASLIKALESEGIGRPSTYAPIISNVQEKNYIEKNEKRFFRPTEIGTVVNDLLVKHFPEIVDTGFTSAMEEELDKIAQGEENWKKVAEKFYQPFIENLNKKYGEVSKKEFTEQETEKKCPKCGSPLVIRLGKFGKFYACSSYPECKYTESLPENKLGIQCPKCKEGEILEKRTRKNKIFYGCSRFPECDFALWDKPLNETCPKCGSLLTETSRKQIKCSNKECDYKR